MSCRLPSQTDATSSDDFVDNACFDIYTRHCLRVLPDIYFYFRVLPENNEYRILTYTVYRIIPYIKL